MTDLHILKISSMKSGKFAHRGNMKIRKRKSVEFSMGCIKDGRVEK